MRDLKTIQEITGERDIRYYDAAYLKQRLKSTLLAQDRRNIQMLTCFSLENILRGLMLLLRDFFGMDYSVSTIVLDETTGEIKRKIDGAGRGEFAVDIINHPEYKDSPILFQINIKGRGMILMDMFQRSTKFN